MLIKIHSKITWNKQEPSLLIISQTVQFRAKNDNQLFESRKSRLVLVRIQMIRFSEITKNVCSDWHAVLEVKLCTRRFILTIWGEKIGFVCLFFYSNCGKIAKSNPNTFRRARLQCAFTGLPWRTRINWRRMSACTSVEWFVREDAEAVWPSHPNSDYYYYY